MIELDFFLLSRVLALILSGIATIMGINIIVKLEGRIRTIILRLVSAIFILVMVNIIGILELFRNINFGLIKAFLNILSTVLLLSVIMNVKRTVNSFLKKKRK